MAITVRHAFTNPKADGPDATIVRPSNWNADHVVTGEVALPGMIIDFAGVSWPSYFLECAGQSVSAAAYPLLFAALVKQATVTLTLGSPGIVNWSAHGLKVYSQVKFKTTGALPTGLNDVNTFHVSDNGGYGANSFRVTDDVDDPDTNFTGSQSGVHTAIHAPFGVSADLTTFSIPDLRGRVSAGYEMMNATDEDWPERLDDSTDMDGRVLGNVGGDNRNTLSIAQLPAHNHNLSSGWQFVAFAGAGGTASIAVGTTHIAVASTNNTGSGQSHNNVQPSIITRKLIYTG